MSLAKEMDFISWFNKESRMRLEKTDGQFTRWDFQDSNYILELKIRNDYYAEKYMQVDKGLSLIQNAEALDKIPLYVVVDTQGTYVFNLNKIEIDGREIIRMKAPIKTEFGNSKRIYKYFYKLSESEAVKTYKI
mgnify:CR=1 FL=1